MQTLTLKDQILAAIKAHGEWKFRLRSAINTGKSEWTPHDIQPDNRCVFGQWLHGREIPAEAKNACYFKAIELHANFHRLASKILDMALKGQKEEALKMIEGEYAQLSNDLKQTLMHWVRETS